MDKRSILYSGQEQAAFCSLDEEAANLIRFLVAEQISSRIQNSLRPEVRGDLCFILFVFALCLHI